MELKEYEDMKKTSQRSRFPEPGAGDRLEVKRGLFTSSFTMAAMLVIRVLILI